MQQQLTTEEKAKVFAMYYPLQPINRVQYPYIVYSTIFAIELLEVPKHDLPDMVLPLTDLKDISDEDAIEVAKMQGYSSGQGKYAYPVICKEIFNSGIKINYECYQYLISNGYAVPLFFGINHWANNKTAIDLGIAINKNKL